MPVTTLFPDYYQFFPQMASAELEETVKKYGFHLATFLNARNLIELAGTPTGVTLVRDYFGEPPENRRKLLSEVFLRVGIDSAITSAFCRLDRLNFMPDPAYDSFCYLNDYVPFSDGSCLSAPGLVALMIERLQVQSGQRILEVGCGSGFHAAWISELVDNDCTIVGAEINEDYGLLGRMALHRAGYSNIDLRLGDAEIVLDTDERFDRIYLTAANQSGMPTFLETFLRDDGIIQYVRGINREEFESQPNDTWLPQTFGDFKGYISGDWRRFCCIATARKTCDGMVEIDRLFDVSFVPFVNHRQPNSAKPRDPFIELQPFLPLHISEC